MSVWLPWRPSAPQQAVPVLFLDRDGVVIEDRDYLSDPAGVQLVPGAAEAMQTARDAGLVLVGVSNQSGLGRGYFGLREFDAVMARVSAELAAAGVHYDGFYYCPHGPQDHCRCRKPRPGLLEEAADSGTFDPRRSWVVGDKASDVALGLQAGLGGVLVRTGYGAAEEQSVRQAWPQESRLIVADDLPGAVALILAANEAADADETADGSP